MNELQIFIIVGSLISSTMGGIWVNAIMNNKILATGIAIPIFLLFTATLPWYMCNTYHMCNGFIFK
jgi:hypothetical protein